MRRVLVFSDGRIVRELTGDAISEEAIVDASFMNKLAADADQTAAPRWNRPWSQRLVAAVPFIALAGVLGVMIAVNSNTASVFGLDLLLGPAQALVLVALAQNVRRRRRRDRSRRRRFRRLDQRRERYDLVAAPSFGALCLVGALGATRSWAR